MTLPGRLVAAGLALLALLLVAPATSGVAAPAADQPAATIDVTSISPALVDPRATLTVTGVIINTGAVPLELVGVRLRLARQGLDARSDLAAWHDGTDARTGAVVGPTLDVQPRSIAVGAQAPFALAVPATQLALGSQPFGAYALAVEVRAQGELGRQQVGLLRTTLQWQPGRKEYAPQQLAWLVPITGPPSGVGATATPEQIALAVGPGSRLRRVLDAASAPGVAWAVDPALLQALNRAATPTVTDPTDQPAPTPSANPDEGASGVVAGFVRDLRAAAAGRVVVELPYADPDLAAVTAGGRTDLVRDAQAAGAGIVEQVLGITPLTGVAWPAEGWASDPTVRALATVGARDVVLDGRSRRLVDVLPYTADARADLPGGVTGWLADPTLSSLAASARSADVTRVQRMLAETAVATAERPGLTRRLLVVAPRVFDPDPAAFRALVQATSTVPWLTVVPVTDLRGPAPGSDTDDSSDLPRLPAEPPAVSLAQLPAAHVAAVRRIRGVLSALGEVVDSPASVTDDLRRSTLELLSSSWRGRTPELTQQRAQVASQVRGLTDQLRVLPSSVNFLTSSGRLQITVANELPTAVTGLRLRVASTNPRLRVIQGDVAIPQLAGRTRAQVQVPVQALGSGKVLLNAQLVSPSGRPLGQLEQVSVRAQPTDTWGLWLLGAVAGLVLVVGLVRALRRPRRARIAMRARAGEGPS